MASLKEGLGKRFLATGEITVPRGPQTEKLKEEIEEYKSLGRIDAVNVVDHPGSILHMASLPASILLKQAGVEPIFQLTCRDRNVLALQGDLYGAAAFGIENVLALTGDPPGAESSDHPKAKGVFELNSVSLIKLIKNLNAGKNHAGGELKKKTNFFVGAALAPGAPNSSGEMKKTKLKLEAGCDFFQTQVVFDYADLSGFLDGYEKEHGEDIRGRVLVGVLPLHSQSIIPFLRKIPGIKISKEIEEKIAKAQEPLSAGVDVCLDVIEQAKKDGLAGAHIMPAGRIEGLKRIVERL